MRVAGIKEAGGKGTEKTSQGFAGKPPFGSGRFMDMRDNSPAGREMRRAVDNMPPEQRKGFRKELERCKELLERHMDYNDYFRR